MKDLETDFEFPRLNSVLSQIKSLNFLNNPLSNGATHEYQNTVKYFNSHKQMKIMKSCFKHPSVNFPVFLIKDMELIPITWTIPIFKKP